MNTYPAVPSKFIAWLTINRGCQLRCNWCYAQDSGFNSKMSNETLEKSIQILTELNVKEVCLIGGEPTIDPRFLEIVRMLVSSNFYVSVVTNGIKFSDVQFVKQTIQAGVRNVVVSLKDTGREAYIESTHRDVFGDVLLGLKNLDVMSQSDRVKFNLSVTLCGGMTSRIDELLDTIRLSGVRKVTFDTERPIVDGCDIRYDGLAPKQIIDLLVDNYEKIDSLRKSGVEYSIYVTHPHCLFPRGFMQKHEESGRLVSGCQIQRGSGIIIDERGKILPCNHFCGNELGDIKEFRSGNDYIAWRNCESIMKFYKSVSSYPSAQCSVCERWEKCGSGCRINWLKFDESEMIRK